jgi:NitT/TauT family transport system permease protein
MSVAKQTEAPGRAEAPDTPDGETLRDRPRHVPLPVWQLLFGITLLAVWHLLSGRVLDPFFFSSPGQVANYLYDYVLNGMFVSDAWFTLRAALVGYIFGSVLGLLLGFAIAEARTLARVLNPYILAVYGIPRIALAPLFIVWFGIGIQSKIMLAAMMAFFLTFFNTFTGVGQVQEKYVTIARVAGASRLDIVRKVVLPDASPWIIAGLRIAIPYSIVAAIVGEFIASTQGLGYRIVLNSQQFNTTGTLGGVIVVMFVVMAANLLLDKVEGYVLRWQPDSGGGRGQGGGGGL